MSVMHYLLSNGVQQPYLFPADIKWELNPKKFTVIEYLIQWPWWQKDNRQDGKDFIPLMIYLCIYMQYSTLWISLCITITHFFTCGDSMTLEGMLEHCPVFLTCLGLCSVETLFLSFIIDEENIYISIVSRGITDGAKRWLNFW